MKKLLMLLGLGLLIIKSQAQNQYTIDVNERSPLIRTDFLKMGSNTSPDGTVLSYNSMYLIRNQKPWFPVMGELHFSRVPQTEWETSILKMKASGIQIISTYVFWIQHEYTEGVFDWRENRNLRAFLALCKKHQVYVWLRPGPWVHAEARNGGFPDWLMKKNIRLRTNDDRFLKFCSVFFKQIKKQCDGFFFKEGGPIIGTQIENELVFKDVRKYDYMKKLKGLSGFDVPYFSAFAEGPDTQDEFLYMIGSYPDSPWANGTGKLFKPMYFIRPLAADSDIGSDLFGKVDSTVKNTYPKLSAELGSGMQVTYHRRVLVSPTDVAAMVYAKIASGLNGLGYYMYHGGINSVYPTMQESRESGYPNDVPIVNYDFQAPIGAMNMESASNKEFRLLHLFLNDFGTDLVQQTAYFPKQPVKSFFSRDTLQTSLRIKNNAGFIFLNNYQRFIDLPEVSNFQLKVNGPKGSQLIPQVPVAFPANSFAIWPFNLKIGAANLYYATAQPLCVLNKTTYVFFSQGPATLLFDGQPVASAHNCKVSSSGSRTQVSIGAKATSKIRLKNGYEIIVIPKEKALESSKLVVNKRDYLVITKAGILANAGKIELESLGKDGKVEIQVYPKAKLHGLEAGVKTVNSPADPLFATISLIPQIKAEGMVTASLIKASPDTALAKSRRDSILKIYSLSKTFRPSQPGPLYQTRFADLPGQHVYSLEIQWRPNTLIKNWLADFNYTGDVLALYKDNSLLYDQFNYNNHCSFKFTENDLKHTKNWKLQILPLPQGATIYVDDSMLDSKKNEWTQGILNGISMNPVWRFTAVILP